MSDDQPRGGLNPPFPPGQPNVELAVFELTKAVIRMETVLDALVDKTFPAGLAGELSGTLDERAAQYKELAQVRVDILGALNAITGKRYGG
ncbi:hypothetical protein E6C67_14340 [Azospirillum sp. TSA2s]|uniref:hypothetical protein n=1 Tax=Azospirillum sp. TSA2s TaxID=709810 RepID=UPI0010AB2318|nr:hypothetical protein [Azospirillum sp. TSA2s]QCG95005.1 hypothetical protein E6C67_14340 [Azospirillum sp. TSA2s]